MFAIYADGRSLKLQSLQVRALVHHNRRCAVFWGLPTSTRISRSDTQVVGRLAWMWSNPKKIELLGGLVVVVFSTFFVHFGGLDLRVQQRKGCTEGFYTKNNVKKQRKNTRRQPKPPYCPTVAAVKGHSPPVLGGVPKNCEEYRESPLKPKVPVSGEHPPVAGARQGEATTVRCKNSLHSPRRHPNGGKSVARNARSLPQLGNAYSLSENLPSSPWWSVWGACRQSSETGRRQSPAMSTW